MEPTTIQQIEEALKEADILLEATKQKAEKALAEGYYSEVDDLYSAILDLEDQKDELLALYAEFV